MKLICLIIFVVVTINQALGSFTPNVPIVSIRFDPGSPVIENDSVNVTLYCDVIDGNPRNLLKVQWFLNGSMLKELPICNDDTNFDNSLCDIDSYKILLQDVGREFMGNYSCRGFNAAGWGDESKTEFLEVYYEPGDASISFYPKVPVKGKKLVLTCTVEEYGNPPAHHYRWLRGDKPVFDVVTSVLTIDPAGLDSRNNFSCYAHNDGGNGGIASTYIDIYAAPAFIKKLPPTSGALFSNPSISLSCRVECYPKCSIFWDIHGIKITDDNSKYFIRESFVPMDSSTGDFESFLSVLYFNISSWPGHKLDIQKDNANYSCISSSNSIGVGVRSSTYFNAEFPPENVIVYHDNIEIDEGLFPPRVICTAKSYPEPNYYWKHPDGEIIDKGNALMWRKVVRRNDAGTYSCVAQNKHGSSEAKFLMTVRYAPNCRITRQYIEGEDTLICQADGNPQNYHYVWEIKSEYETADEQLKYTTQNKKSYLSIPNNFHEKRVYRCIANNTMGNGNFCEMQVAGLMASHRKNFLWFKIIK